MSNAAQQATLSINNKGELLRPPLSRQIMLRVAATTVTEVVQLGWIVVVMWHPAFRPSTTACSGTGRQMSMTSTTARQSPVRTHVVGAEEHFPELNHLCA